MPRPLPRSGRIFGRQIADATRTGLAPSAGRADPEEFSGYRKRFRRSSPSAARVRRHAAPATNSPPRPEIFSKFPRRRWCRGKSNIQSPVNPSRFPDNFVKVDIRTIVRRQTFVERRCGFAARFTDLIGFERAFDDIGNRASFAPSQPMRNISRLGASHGKLRFSHLELSTPNPNPYYYSHLDGARWLDSNLHHADWIVVACVNRRKGRDDQSSLMQPRANGRLLATSDFVQRHYSGPMCRRNRISSTHFRLMSIRSTDSNPSRTRFTMCAVARAQSYNPTT